MNFLKNHKKIFQHLLFGLYIIISLISMLYHEPWRDEIHAWTMADYLSVKDLFIVSRYDGHPILWHLLLMPFAKLNFPIITLNIISFLIVSISAWLFIYKTNLNFFFKFITLFTVPFLYTFSSISRNYCLILLLLIAIAILYKKRYSHPILYSSLIALLIHTHALSWGIVAGLTITFHIYEIYLYYFKKQKNVNIKHLLIGFSIIFVNTLLVIYELFGNVNPDYVIGLQINNLLIIFTVIACILLAALVFICYFKKNIKEYIILVISLLFQCLVYGIFYSAILLPRYILIFAIFLFFIILIDEANANSSDSTDKKLLNSFYIIYIAVIISFNAIYTTYTLFLNDLKYPYSSAKEMAEYINTNLFDEDTILVDASILCQTLVPYLDNAELYDIVYNDYYKNLNYYSNERAKINYALNNLNQYKGKYIILSTPNVVLKYPIVYKTSGSLSEENYTLYYIN